MKGETLEFKLPITLMLLIRIACVIATILVAALVTSNGPGTAQPVTSQIAAWAVLGGSAHIQQSGILAAKRWKRPGTHLPPPMPEKGIIKRHNVSLSAVLAPGSGRLSEGISWRILKLGQPEDKEPDLVWSGGGAEPELSLKPGRYYVEATYGLAKNGLEISLGADENITPVVSLDAGTLHVHGSALPGGGQLNDMFFTLRKSDAPAGKTEDVGRSSLSQAVFHVPAGQYQLLARHGLSSIEMPVTLSPARRSRSRP